MHSLFAISLMLVGLLSQAAELTSAPDLKAPVPTEKKAVLEVRNIALGWWARNQGLMAEESFRVAGHFQVARPIPKFAARDDRVWEVRVIHLHTGGPSGILWINDRTKQVIALGAAEKKRARPDGPANGSQPIRSETDSTSSAAGFRR